MLLYSELLNVLAVLFVALGGAGLLFMTFIIAPKRNWGKQKTIGVEILPFLAGIILALTMCVFGMRIERTTFYSDEYDIVAMSDGYGLAEYKEIPESERERFVIERMGHGERIKAFLHEDTIKMLTERNSHAGYEEYLY